MAQAQRESGSEDQLREMLAAHGERLLRSAFLLCGDETEAQDLVQETFLQALKSARAFRGDSAVYTWLHGIMRNLCHRHLRHQKRLVFDEQLVGREATVASPASEQDEAFCADRLAQAIADLSPEHREVIVLRYYENLKLQEIAARTGVSAGTVKSRLHYAARCLEQLIPAEMNLFVAQGTHDQEAR